MESRIGIGPLVVGLGGTVRPGSSTEAALRVALNAAEQAGARTILVESAALAALPIYNPQVTELSVESRGLVDAARSADGIILASPGYHGSLSGMVKNALDYFEEMREDSRPYLEGRAVGCIATATGWQAAVSTLMALRSVVHALRGWPTPMGAAVNTAKQVFDRKGGCLDARVSFQLELVGRQVVDFAALEYRDGRQPSRSEVRQLRSEGGTG